MKRLDGNKIPMVQCDRCGATIASRYYTEGFDGLTRYDYRHYCNWWPTMDQMDAAFEPHAAQGVAKDE